VQLTVEIPERTRVSARMVNKFIVNPDRELTGIRVQLGVTGSNLMAEKECYMYSGGSSLTVVSCL
jgi:hypothetical protein